MKLSIPIKSGETIYTEAEIIKPKASVISDANRETDSSTYSSIRVFIAGCLSSLTDESGKSIDDKRQLAQLSNAIPYPTAEQILFKLFEVMSIDTGVEGVYPCPRCSTNRVCELSNPGGDDEIDTRDFVDDLDVDYMGEYEEGFSVDIESFDPEIKNKDGGEIGEIRSMSFRWPTLKDLIFASQNVGEKNLVELQFSIYSSCLTKINGTEIEKKIRNRYGMHIVKGIPNPSDLKGISKGFKKFGVVNEVKKNCIKCGKTWDVALDVSSFFGEALRAS